MRNYWSVQQLKRANPVRVIRLSFRQEKKMYKCKQFTERQVDKRKVRIPRNVQRIQRNCTLILGLLAAHKTSWFPLRVELVDISTTANVGGTEKDLQGKKYMIWWNRRG